MIPRADSLGDYLRENRKAFESDWERSELIWPKGVLIL